MFYEVFVLFRTSKDDKVLIYNIAPSVFQVSYRKLQYPV
jgi:hypothetical protein